MAKNGRTVSRSATTGRFVSKREATYAARARVTADEKRGKTTPAWIKTLATGTK